MTDTGGMGTFPRAVGRNLEGWRYTLPFDLEGKLNVVVIAFGRVHWRAEGPFDPSAAAGLVPRLETR